LAGGIATKIANHSFRASGIIAYLEAGGNLENAQAMEARESPPIEGHAQVRAVHLTLTPWTVEAGLLTPTLKIKRDTLERHFAKEIAALYAEK
jgi:long-chain acyl-CoA synthetase